MKNLGFEGCLTDAEKPSPKRVRVEVVENVLGLYRERYFDLNVRHFHEKLQEKHQVEISYSWVKGILQGATHGAKRLVTATAFYPARGSAHLWHTDSGNVFFVPLSSTSAG